MREPNLDEAVEQWRTKGWVLLPALVPTEEIDAVADDLWTMYAPPEVFHAAAVAAAAVAAAGGSLDGPLEGRVDGDAAPDRRLVDFRTRRDPDFRLDEPPTGTAGFRTDQFLGMRVFPFPGPGRLNRLAVHERVVGFARLALGTDDIRLYQAQAWAKYTGVADYAQAMHRDGNHSLLPALTGESPHQLEGFVYLSDVLDESDGPTRLRSVLEPDGDGIPALGPRGSFLAYRPDVWHRGTNLTRSGGSRFVANFSYRRADVEWGGYTTFGNLAPNGWFKRFVAASTPDELQLIGIPRPGHPVWTAPMVDTFAAMYPGLDVGPWREALDPRAAQRVDATATG